MDELSAIAAGDTDAFARWVAGVELALFRSLRPFAERVDVEAIVQETLLRAWQVAPQLRLDGQPHPLLRFALTAAKNLAMSELRRAKVEPTEQRALEEALAVAAPVAPTTSDPFVREAITECQKKLPGKPLLAWRARLDASGGRSDLDLAQSLGMRLNTFLQNFTRARQLLARCLSKTGDHPRLRGAIHG